MKKPELYIIIIVLFSLLAVINVLASLRIYKRTSQPVVVSAGTTKHAAPQSPETVVSDIKTLLSQNELRRNSYQLIADKNLFSPQRKAWQPPVEEQVEPRKEVVSKSRRTDVVLYGTFTVGNKIGALLEFVNFKKGQRKKTLFPGDQVSSVDGAKKGRTYTLLKVEPSFVTVKDNKGVIFAVDLYDEKKPQQKVVKTKTTISVTGDSSNKSTSVVAGASRSVEAAKVVKARTAAAAQKKKLKTGELRKVQTPFGTTYIKSNKAKK